MPKSEDIDDYTVKQVLKIMTAYYRDGLRTAKADPEDLAAFFTNGKLIQGCIITVINKIYTDAEKANIFNAMKNVFESLLEGEAWEGVIPE